MSRPAAPKAHCPAARSAEGSPVRRKLAAIAAALGLCLALSAAPVASQTAAAYDGPKKTVSVDPFQAAETLGGSVTAEGMSALLAAALIKDGRFLVVERPGLASVQAEQALGQSGMAAPETAARAGQLLGAGAIVRGVVTKFEAAASGGGLSLGSLPIPSMFGMGVGAGIKSQTSVLEISLRLIDTTTGQVISMTTAQGSATASGADATLIKPNSGLSVGAGTFQRTPMGQAGEQAIVKAVEQIAAGMRSMPWSALVIESSNGLIYVNAGADRNMQAGVVLKVSRRGKVLTDPGTGQVLDIEMQDIGTIRIVGIRDKLSTAELVSGENPARGDVLKLN
jgi:curli biogenesis system outer membrane secretion channel CsgG